MTLTFKDELRAYGLEKFPEGDHENFELYVKAIRESANRIKQEFSYAEEPCNIFPKQVNTNE